MAAIDGLSGFSDAIHAVFPKTRVQRCVIHQIRTSLKYVVWKDRKAFTADLKTVYQASTREEAEANLLKLEETWGGKYRAAIKSWQNNWEELATFFEFPNEIRRLIYTTNTVEGYHRQLRKVLKNKSSFSTPSGSSKTTLPGYYGHHEKMNTTLKTGLRFSTNWRSALKTSVL